MTDLNIGNRSDNPKPDQDEKSVSISYLIVVAIILIGAIAIEWHYFDLWTNGGKGGKGSIVPWGAGFLFLGFLLVHCGWGIITELLRRRSSPRPTASEAASAQERKPWSKRDIISLFGFIGGLTGTSIVAALYGNAVGAGTYVLAWGIGMAIGAGIGTLFASRRVPE